jgi:hypothetical protein
MECLKLRFPDPQISINIQGLKKNHQILHPIVVDLANSIQGCLNATTSTYFYL